MKSSKYISILCVGSLLSLASCTDGFESDNKINGSFDDTGEKAPLGLGRHSKT